eukprot:3463263-Alexandrium_andersonii.AAC.1
MLVGAARRARTNPLSMGYALACAGTAASTAADSQRLKLKHPPGPSPAAAVNKNTTTQTRPHGAWQARAETREE